jgi:hypothetical protein
MSVYTRSDPNSPKQRGTGCPCSKRRSLPVRVRRTRHGVAAGSPSGPASPRSARSRWRSSSAAAGGWRSPARRQQPVAAERREHQRQRKDLHAAVAAERRPGGRTRLRWRPRSRGTKRRPWAAGRSWAELFRHLRRCDCPGCRQLVVPVRRGRDGERRQGRRRRFWPPPGRRTVPRSSRRRWPTTRRATTHPAPPCPWSWSTAPRRSTPLDRATVAFLSYPNPSLLRN